MKKGQIFGQPLMYIFFAIVAVLILGFGIKLAVDFSNLGNDVTIKVFKEDIEKKVNIVYSDSFESSISLADIKVPSTIREICFLDSSKKEVDFNDVIDEGLRKVIQASYEAISDNNVFIKGEELEISRISVLVLDEALVCDDLSDGKIDIKLINSGQTVKAQHI